MVQPSGSGGSVRYLFLKMCHLISESSTRPDISQNWSHKNIRIFVSELDENVNVQDFVVFDDFYAIKKNKDRRIPKL